MEVLRDREDAKEGCLEVYKEENRKIKRYMHKSKKEVHEQFGRKMNQAVNGDRKLFWKEVIKRIDEKWRIVAE